MSSVASVTDSSFRDEVPASEIASKIFTICPDAIGVTRRMEW